MNLRDFLNQTKLNMLARDLNAHVAGQTWRSPRTIEISRSVWARDVHHVGRDANGENTLVDLQESVLNASQVLFRSSRAQLLKVYALVPSSGATHGGKRLDHAWLVELRDPKGKKHSFTIEHNRDETGSNPLCFIMNQHSEIERRRLDNIINNWRYGGHEMLEQALPEGWRIVTVFEYNFSIWFAPKRLKRTKRGVTLSYDTNGTYQSLPCLIEIKMARETDVLSLADAGIETRGYYSHDTKLYIRPKQLKAAKRLAAKARRLK